MGMMGVLEHHENKHRKCQETPLQPVPPHPPTPMEFVSQYSVPATVGTAALLVAAWFLYPQDVQYQEARGRLSKIAQEVETGLASQIGQLYAEKGKYDDSQAYQLGFYQEELLKKLIKLDDVDLTVIGDAGKKATLKAERKTVIRRIQGLLKGLDEWRA